MTKWIELLPKKGSNKRCSKHKDRAAMAVRMRTGDNGGPPIPTRYYCLECYHEQGVGTTDHGPD